MGKANYSKILSLRFPKSVVDKPIVSDLVKRYDLSFNMLKATIYPRQEGLVILELSGQRKNYNQGIRYQFLLLVNRLFLLFINSHPDSFKKMDYPPFQIAGENSGKITEGRGGSVRA